MEVWREVPGYDGWYECSSEGRVRTWRNPGANGFKPPSRRAHPHVMSPGKTRGGYLFVALCSEGSVKQYRLNRLVLLTFEGEPGFDGAQACHRNGDHQDNRLSNLYWGTPAENQADKDRHGTQLRGEEMPDAKLTREAVAEARTLWATGEYTVRRLADRYGVSGPTIWRAVTRKTWRVVA